MERTLVQYTTTRMGAHARRLGWDLVFWLSFGLFLFAQWLGGDGDGDGDCGDGDGGGGGGGVGVGGGGGDHDKCAAPTW